MEGEHEAYWFYCPAIFALLFVTNIACAPVVYVQPTGTMSFQQLLQADATIGGRVAAHNMRARVREDAPIPQTGVLEPLRLPEAYTLGGTEAKRMVSDHCQRSG